MTERKATAVTAAKKEAVESTDLTFEFDGHEYTVDREGVTDVDFLEAYEDGRGIGMCRELLGPSQWARFKATKRVKDVDVIALSEAMFEALGTDSEK